MASDQPKRIQRKRTRGWRTPAGAIYVGRPTKWGNPSYVAKLKGFTRAESHAAAVKAFGWWLITEGEGSQIAEAAKAELRGHDLVCWCRLDEPCHADVLLRVANG